MNPRSRLAHDEKGSLELQLGFLIVEYWEELQSADLTDEIKMQAFYYAYYFVEWIKGSIELPQEIVPS